MGFSEKYQEYKQRKEAKAFLISITLKKFVAVTI